MKGRRDGNKQPQIRRVWQRVGFTASDTPFTGRNNEAQLMGDDQLTIFQRIVSTVARLTTHRNAQYLFMFAPLVLLSVENFICGRIFFCFRMHFELLYCRKM